MSMKTRSSIGVFQIVPCIQLERYVLCKTLQRSPFRSRAGRAPDLGFFPVGTNQSMATDVQLFGFPPGYFVIRSLATGRLWDVSGDGIEDGTEVVLWPEKEHSLVESERRTVYLCPF